MVKDAYAASGHSSGFYLDRYVTGAMSPNLDVPVCSVCSPMTVSQFLSATEVACGGCLITPRLSLELLSGNGEAFWAASTSLLGLGFQYVSLDDLGRFVSTYNSAQQHQVYQELLSQGWKGFGLNECSGYTPSFGLATWAMICFNASQGYVPSNTELAGVRSEPNIKYVIGQIDFPGDATRFYSQPYDNVASEITTMVENQGQYGYHYLYLGVQGVWDTNQMATSALGPYHGQTILQVEEALVQKTSF